MTSANTAPTDRIETTECSRCCGTGRYSYNQIHGSRCYGCGGSGKKRTRRGAEAFRFLEELRSKRADAFVPGDLMRYDMFTPGGSARIFVRVTSVSPSKAKVIINGKPSEAPSVTIEGEHAKLGKVRMTTSADKIIRQGFDAETKQAQLKQAIAYQATLTVKGKVSKVAPRAA